MDEKLEAWARKIQDAVRHDLSVLRARNIELEGTVTRLTRHVSSLEMKIDSMTTRDKMMSSRLNKIELLCGCSDTLGDVKRGMVPEHNICSRLENLEICLTRVEGEVKRVDRRNDTEQRYRHCSQSSGGSSLLLASGRQNHQQQQPQQLHHHQAMHPPINQVVVKTE